jgi:hypothetical protein
MRVRNLIIKLDERETLPVEVDDIVDYLREQQIKDEIDFVGVDVNTEVLRGAIKHYVLPGLAYGEPTFCAEIYYDQTQGNDWVRLVCCKELLHILDPDALKVRSKADFLKLVEKIVLPAEFQDPIKDGAKVMSDRIATYLAVAALFPWGARTILMPAYREGKLSIEDIAVVADLPLRYVALVMSDEWVEIHKIMTTMIEY